MVCELVNIKKPTDQPHLIDFFEDSYDKWVLTLEYEELPAMYAKNILLEQNSYWS